MNGALRRMVSASEIVRGEANPEPQRKRSAGPVEVVVAELPPRALTIGPLPWYFAAPRIAMCAIQVFMAPFAFFVKICEVVVSVTFTAMVAVIFAWWFKFIPDSDVGLVIASLGDRVQGILKGVGAL
ncbi:MULTISPECIES: hypothetical protein [unclassified Bradyrhizobium]